MFVRFPNGPRLGKLYVLHCHDMLSAIGSLQHSSQALSNTEQSDSPRSMPAIHLYTSALEKLALPPTTDCVGRNSTKSVSWLPSPCASSHSFLSLPCCRTLLAAFTTTFCGKQDFRSFPLVANQKQVMI